MGNKKFEDALKKVTEELKNMPKAEFEILLKKHKNGPYARILRESGYFKKHECGCGCKHCPDKRY